MKLPVLMKAAHPTYSILVYLLPTYFLPPVTCTCFISLVTGILTFCHGAPVIGTYFLRLVTDTYFSVTSDTCNLLYTTSYRYIFSATTYFLPLNSSTYFLRLVIFYYQPLHCSYLQRIVNYLVCYYSKLAVTLC